MGFTLKDAFVEFDDVDISSYVRSVDISEGLQQLEDNTMGDEAETFQPGLKTRTISFTVRPLFGASEFDGQMWPKFDAGTTGTLKYRPSSGAVGAGNPERRGTFFISEYPNTGGDHGQKVEGTLTFALAADDYVRATS